MADTLINSISYKQFMKFVCVLWGGCAELSLAELRACVCAQGSFFEVVLRDGRVVVFRARHDVDFSGLALLNEVCLFFGDDVSSVDCAKLNCNVKVRGKKVGSSVSFSVAEVERKVGKRLYDSGVKVDFSSDCVVRVYVTEKKCYFGKVVCSIDKKGLRARDAKMRPYFECGTLNAVDARAFVNLLRCGRRDMVLDPFCGSGAFLIEAGILGMDVFGCDIVGAHVSGARRNLLHYGVAEGKVILMDALDAECLCVKFDGVVCDLPWGKSTVIKSGKDEVYRGFMGVLPKILKKGKYAVIACDVGGLWYPAELKLVEMFEIYVHRSANRYVYVFMRK